MNGAKKENTKMLTFDEWFEQQREELKTLLRNDQQEALYLAWFAGYEAGLTAMGDLLRIKDGG